MLNSVITNHKNIYVINLAKDKDKWNEIKNTLILKHQINPIRIDGIYGKNLEKKYLKANTDWLNYYFASPSLIGCFLSHKKAWKTILKRNDPWALILEDDAKILVQDLGKSLEQTLQSVPKDFDICYLGCHGKCHPEKKYKWYQSYLGLYQKVNGYRITPNLFVPEVASGAYGYIVSKKGAQKLCQFIQKVNYPVDMELSANFHKLRVYAIYPYIVGYTHEQESNMTSSDRPMLKYLPKAIQLKSTYYQYHILSYPLNLYAAMIFIIGFILGLILHSLNLDISFYLGFLFFYVIINCQMLETAQGRKLLLGDILILSLGYSLSKFLKKY